MTNKKIITKDDDENLFDFITGASRIIKIMWNWVILGAVIFAFFFTIGFVVLENMNATENFLDIQNQYFQEIKEARELNFQKEPRLQKEIDELNNNVEQNKSCKPQP